MRPVAAGRDLVLVDALQRDRVDLDLEAGRLRGVDARPAPCVRSPQRVMRAELVGVEGIERHVDALHAAGGEVAGDGGRAASRWW